MKSGCKKAKYHPLEFQTAKIAIFLQIRKSIPQRRTIIALMNMRRPMSKKREPAAQAPSFIRCQMYQKQLFHNHFGRFAVDNDYINTRIELRFERTGDTCLTDNAAID